MPSALTTTPVRRFATVCALALAALVLLARPAAAHADLVSSSPSDGAVIASEPRQVTLLFSEEVTLRLSSVRVIGPDGHRIDDGPLRASGPGGDGLAVDLSADPEQGTFVLDWLATAADDGHATSGTLTFSVGAPGRTAAAARLGTPDRVTDAVLDLAVWLGFAGLALLVGSTAVRLRCLPADPDRTADLHRPAVLGWAVLLTGTLVQLFVQGPATQGDPLARVTDRALLAATLSTHEGNALVARIVLLALIAAAGEVLLRQRWAAVPAVLLTLALAGTWSETSHAASGTLVPLALAVTTLHVTAMAVWAGGLLSLGLLLTRGSADPDLGTTARRFSRLALASVAVLAATGLYQAFREVGSTAELTGTSYGRFLLLKTAVLVPVLAAAAVSRARVTRHPQNPGTAGLRRSVLFELAGVTVILVVTVLLIGSPPPGPV